MRFPRHALPVALLLLAAGCAEMPKQPVDPKVTPAEANAWYQRGLESYRASRFDQALTDLNAAVASGHLRSADVILARKHAAFIYCTTAREPACREQFQAILAMKPDFDLAPNEAGHPSWGPVWRSLKGIVEEKRAVSQAARPTASPAQQKLAEGVRDYEAGRYKESIDALQAALGLGFAQRTDELRARKYMAFGICLTKTAKLCRAEFAQIFTLDPAFELLPSETGHPSWAAAYRAEKAAAAKKSAAPKQPAASTPAASAPAKASAPAPAAQPKASSPAPSAPAKATAPAPAPPGARMKKAVRVATNGLFVSEARMLSVPTPHPPRIAPSC